jgi:hypothetical protein
VEHLYVPSAVQPGDVGLAAEDPKIDSAIRLVGLSPRC